MKKGIMIVSMMVAMVAAGYAAGTSVKQQARAAESSLSQAHAFPVPLETNKMPSVITFSDLALTCTIRIYTISGELVKTIAHTNNTLGQEAWDTKNEDGNLVASGAYIYCIQSSSDNKQGILMIIR